MGLQEGPRPWIRPPPWGAVSRSNAAGVLQEHMLENTHSPDKTLDKAYRHNLYGGLPVSQSISSTDRKGMEKASNRAIHLTG